MLRAAARAHKATGAPITTHTDEGTMGREQLDILADEGVDLQRVIIGHSCGSADLRYHVDMLDRGCYLGFDRFGLEILQPDRLRLAALIGLLGIGFERQIVLSHDTVWCWRGRPLPVPVETLAPNWDPTHVFQHIVPALREAGVRAGEDRRDADRQPAPLLRSLIGSAHWGAGAQPQHAWPSIRANVCAEPSSASQEGTLSA